jgi:DNA-directed RNA polymerase I and III subunit RPAC1
MSSIPTPTISNISNENDIYRFTFSNMNVSIANSIRRIILTEIPTVCFITETEPTNTCTIIENSSRLHNEIIKQRLSCIPVFEKTIEKLPEKYILEINVKNETENTVFVTTEDFKIKNKTSGEYITNEEIRNIFPPDPITNQYIDFVRLRPKINGITTGEHLHLTCEFSVSTAKYNSSYNIVSKCSYEYTPDIDKINEVWEQQQNKLLSEELSPEDIEFQKRNFMLLDSQRYYIKNSFNFVIQTIGIYENQEILKKATAIIQNKFIDYIQAIDSDIIPIRISETTIDNCFDIILEEEDYTLGKVIEYILYETLYLRDKTLTFCGFKKIHPHDNFSIVRLAFAEKVDKNTVRQVFRSVCVDAADLYKHINKMF